MLRSSRPTTWRQNHVFDKDDTWSISPIQEFSTPAKIGSMTAHRNGLERAKLEHSSSQPMVGSAHKAFTGSIRNSFTHIATRCVGDHSSGNGLIPCSSAYRLIRIRKPSCRA